MAKGKASTMSAGIKSAGQAGNSGHPTSCDDGNRMRLLLALMEGSLKQPEATKAVSPKLTSSLALHPPIMALLPPKRLSGVITNTNGSSLKRGRITPPADVLGHVRQKQKQIKLTPLAKPPRLSTAKFLAVHMRHNSNSNVESIVTSLSGKKGAALRKPHPLRSFNYNDMPRSAVFQTTPAGRISCSLTSPAESSSERGGSSCCSSERESSNGSSSEEAPSLLHSVCCWNDHEDLASIVSNVLCRDHEAIRRRFKLARTSKVDPKSVFRPERGSHEPYTLPLNLALLHQPKQAPNMKVLHLLAERDPDVLLQDDNGTSSLLITLRHHPTNLALVQLLFQTNPRCIHVSDQRGNTPLHVACSNGNPSLDVVQEVYRRCPAAMDQKNINGETPWSMIQRKTHLSSSPVGEFLYACSVRRGRRSRKISTPRACATNERIAL